VGVRALTIFPANFSKHHVIFSTLLLSANQACPRKIVVPTPFTPETETETTPTMKIYRHKFTRCTWQRQLVERRSAATGTFCQPRDLYNNVINHSIIHIIIIITYLLILLKTATEKETCYDCRAGQPCQAHAGTDSCLQKKTFKNFLKRT